MAEGRSDYDAIRRANHVDYGIKRDWWETLLADVYSLRTHFILELLQNAEDARHEDGVGATQIEFELGREQLCVRHNGRPFSQEDVRAICHVGTGTKKGDASTIGKFGIGFKSVYAYTVRPSVHCPPEHFAIEQYVDPHAVEEKAPGDGWTTLFEFAFDKPTVPASRAYDEIRRALETLTPRTLLFLEHLECIEWRDEDGNSGRVSRRSISFDGQDVTVVEKDGEVPERWVRFRADPGADEGPRGVELAFLLGTGPDGQRSVVPAGATTVVTYFPTNRPTAFGFLVQGPFDVTPSREGLHEDSEVNGALARAAADLLPDALEQLRDLGWLNALSLEALPLWPPDSIRDPLFRPVMRSARTALMERDLVPRHGGGWAPAARLRYAGSEELRELLSPRQLGALLGYTGELNWFAADISATRTPNLYRCLFGTSHSRSFLGTSVAPLVEHLEVRAERVLGGMTKAFLAAESDDWLVALYRFLSPRRALMKQARTLAIVRREDEEHVVPFSQSDLPQVWLPPPTPTEFPTVKRSIASQPAAAGFFSALGLTMPDRVDDVVRSIVPRYRAGAVSVDDEEHANNLDSILGALRTAGSKRESLLAQLRDVRFIRARGGAEHAAAFASPDEVYLPHDRGFREFADGNPSIRFLADDADTYADLWDALRLPDGPRVRYRSPRWSGGHVTITSRHGWHERGLHGFDPEFSVAGLEHALRTPSLTKSVFIWELLFRYVATLKGQVERSTRQTFEASQVTDNVSVVGQLLAEASWLPLEDGRFVRPSETEMAALHSEMAPNERLADALGMIGRAAREGVAQTLGIEEEDVSLLLQNPDAVAALASSLRHRRRASAAVGGEENTSTTPAEHVVSLQKQTAGPHDVDAPLPPAGPKTAESVANSHEESRKSRTSPRVEKRASTKTELSGQAAELKDAATLELLTDYGGRCQVCRRTFLPSGSGRGCNIVQWQPAIAASGATVSGNQLLLCPWHAALVTRGRFTLSESGTLTSPQLIELVQRSKCIEDLDGETRFELPIYFHDVAYTDDSETRTMRESLSFAEAHWMSFRLWLTGEEE